MGTKKPFMVPVHVAYGGISFLISSLNNVFLLFYMSTFVYIFKIDQTSFYIGETLFLIWNSLNDPMFGWISDNDTIHNDTRKPTTLNDIVCKRLDSLSRYGPLFALSFLLFWFQIFPVGIQFSLALCLYDSFLTMVDLHHQALLADLVLDSNERVKLNSYCSVFSAAGTVTVFVSYTLWNKHDLFPFQTFCIAIAALVFIGFRVCCNSLRYYYNIKATYHGAVACSHSNKDNMVAIKKYVGQVLGHRNFLFFSLMNLIQVFHCHFNSNFFPLVLKQLLGQALTPQAGAFLLGISFLIPHINNLYFLKLCTKYGTYSIIHALFFIKLLLAASMWTIGTEYWYLLCMFVASNRVFTEGICKLLNLILSDLVDEDYVVFRRRSPVSALVLGTSALLSKPGQTLAPLLGSYLMCVNTGKSMFENQEGGGGGKDGLFGSMVKDDQAAKLGCFNVLVSVPIWCALVQIIAWNLFTLHGSYLNRVKSQRSNELSMTENHCV